MIIFIITFLILITLTFFRSLIDKKKFKIAFDKNMAIMLRINGFFVGAIGIDMVLSGIQSLF